MEAPLKGIRVLELARILAGPWIGQTLADLGADVIKVESPAGDDTRTWGPPFVEGEAGERLDAAYFHACNRGKRSVVLDFTTEEGQGPSGGSRRNPTFSWKISRSAVLPNTGSTMKT